MIVNLSTAAKEARFAPGLVPWLDSGAASARLRIYSAPIPPNADAAATGTMLAEVGLMEPCGTVAGGTLTLEFAGSALAAESGVAAWARLVNGNGDSAIDFDVTDTTTATGAVQLNSTTIWLGGSVTITAGSLA